MRTSYAMLALTGCSFVYSDTLDKVQCDAQEDCGSPSLQCVDHVCQGPSNGGQACTQDTECQSGERCGYDNQCYSVWGCMASLPDWPTPTAPFHVKTLLARIDGQPTESIGDVVVTACVSTDPFCANPLVRSEQVTLSAAKQLDIPLPAQTFDGFIKIVAKDPNAANAYAPSFLHVPGASPWTGDFTTELPTNLAIPSITSLLSGVVSLPVEPNTVILGTFLYDCGGRAASGIQVVPTTSTTAPFFPIGQGKVPSKTSKVTDAQGAGFVMNIPTDTPLQQFDLRIPATATTAEQTVASFSVIVQAGGLNFVNFYPRHTAVQAWTKELTRRAAAAP